MTIANLAIIPGCYFDHFAMMYTMHKLGHLHKYMSEDNKYTYRYCYCNGTPTISLLEAIVNLCTLMSSENAERLLDDLINAENVENHKYINITDRAAFTDYESVVRNCQSAYANPTLLNEWYFDFEDDQDVCCGRRLARIGKTIYDFLGREAFERFVMNYEELYIEEHERILRPLT